MTVEYRVTIEGEIHRILVDVPSDRSLDDLVELREFAVSTAYLEHFGYLPRGVRNARD
jgi:hypothetical protein